MKLNNCKNLLELFSFQFKKSKPDDIFLKSLKNENKNYTWKETFDSVQIISSLISKHIEEKDRCLLISENRPEWLISDLSVMLSKGVTVPAYTTYVERDYEYLINDCKPSLLIISNNIQYQKIKNLIKKNTFIKLVISFDKIEDDTNSILNINEILNNKNY